MTRLSIAFQSNKRLSEYGELAALVERLGFDTVSVYNDLFFQPAWMPLLVMAQQTHSIRLGPAAINPFTCHPINIAANMALLDEASQGRAYLGIARGAWLDALGLHPSRPIVAVREAIQVVQHLLCGDRAPFDGHIFHLPENESLRWPIFRSRITIMLGTWGERMVAATADLIDEVKLGGSANPGLVRWMRTRLDQYSPARRIGLAVGAVTVADRDGTRAEQLVRREVAMYLPIVAALDPTYRVDPDEIRRIKAAIDSGDRETAARVISTETLRRFAFYGTTGDIEKQVCELADAGADRIELGTPHGADEHEALELLGKYLLPNFRNP